MRVLNGLLAAMFVLGAVVQLNDPDPLPWIVIYAAAAAACVLWEVGRLGRAAPLVLAAVAVGWAAWTAMGTTLGVPLGEALADWGMHADGSEEAREAGGLLLIAGWCAALALWPRAGWASDRT